MDVIQDSSFEDVELSTVITILDQDSLNVDNELLLFFALNRYADKHGLISQTCKFFCLKFIPPALSIPNIFYKSHLP